MYPHFQRFLPSVSLPVCLSECLTYVYLYLSISSLPLSTLFPPTTHSSSYSILVRHLFHPLSFLSSICDFPLRLLPNFFFLPLLLTLLVCLPLPHPITVLLFLSSSYFFLLPLLFLLFFLLFLHLFSLLLFLHLLLLLHSLLLFLLTPPSLLPSHAPSSLSSSSSSVSSSSCLIFLLCLFFSSSPSIIPPFPASSPPLSTLLRPPPLLLLLFLPLASLFPAADKTEAASL